MIRYVALVMALVVASSGDVAAQSTSDTGSQELQRINLRGSDRDAAPSPDIRLTDALTFGGRFDVKYELEGNYNLDEGTDEQEMVLLPELTFSLSYEPFDDFELFANLALAREYALDEPESENRPLRLQLEEFYVQFDDVLELAGGDVSIQAGRQRFDDPREWLFDERLDGVRAFYERDDFTLELAATRQNNRDLRNSSSRRPIDSYLIYGYQEFEDEEFELLGNDYEIKELLVGGYAMVRNDPNSNGEDLTFLGVQLYGELERLQHWLELSYVSGRGSDQQNRVRGYAFDVGGTYVSELPWGLAFTLGYAFGSGDADPQNGTDNNFRQTGMQDNQAYLADGVVPFRFYGTLLEPELSNLKIRTAGLSIKPRDGISVHLLYHDYQQHKALDELRDTNLDQDPNGENRDIGREIDLVLGLELSRVAVEIETGYFMPGAAFDDTSNDNAFFVEIDFQLRF